MENISTQVFQAATLSEAKEIVFARLAASKVNPDNKKIILDNTYNMTTLEDLQRYICNSMLRFEGLSVNRYKH